MNYRTYTPTTAKPLLGASRRGLCQCCGLIFTSISAFDAHRKNGKCLEPESVGLELKKSGAWGFKGFFERGAE